MLFRAVFSAVILASPLHLTVLASPAKTSGSQSGTDPTSTSGSPTSSSGSGSFKNARFTFYDVGLGACGKTNQPSDFIVALNSQQFGSGYPGPNCFKEITITYNGKTHDATIVDECPGCPYGGLDFSRGLFDVFASEDKGVLYGEWSFKDGGSGSGNSTSNGSGSDGSNGSSTSGSNSSSTSGSGSASGSGFGSGSGSGGPSSTMTSKSTSPTGTSSAVNQGHCGHGSTQSS